MFQKLKAKFLNLNLIVNYRKILPYVKPYWGAGADGRADNDSDWVDGCGDCLGAKTIYGCCYG